MKELIKITQEVIGNEEVNAVNARDLHRVLESKRQYTDWIKYQIKSLNLKENIDFIMFSQKCEIGAAVRDITEYILTIDIAKHIALASRTDKGREIRDYFIEVEKKYRESIPTVSSPILQALIEQDLELQRQKKEIGAVKKKIDWLEAEVWSIPNKVEEAIDSRVKLPSEGYMSLRQYDKIAKLSKDVVRAITANDFFKIRKEACYDFDEDGVLRDYIAYNIEDLDYAVDIVIKTAKKESKKFYYSKILNRKFQVR
jgi:phage anti-repressor protein